jgi:hypothetical protein
MKTAGRSGALTKHITVISNDKANPRLELTIKGEVTVDVAVEPRAVSFGQLGKAEKATRELKITVADPGKLKITEVVSDDPRVVLTRKDGDAAGSGTYEVAFNGSDKIERVASKVTVKYTGSDVTSIDVMVSAMIVGDLRYSKSIYFTKKDDGFEKKEVVINSRSGKDVELKRIEDPDKKLKCTIVRRKGENAMFNAEVADPSASYRQPDQHVLKVYTTDKDEPVVEMRYMITEHRGPSVPGMMRNPPGALNLDVGRPADIGAPPPARPAASPAKPE